MSSTVKETYLVVLTPSEESTLWIVQTDNLSQLMTNLLSECGSRRKAQIFTLSLTEVQLNNCFQGQLLHEVARIGDPSFSLHLHQLTWECLRGLSPEKRIPLLNSALSIISKEVSLLTQKIEDERRLKVDTTSNPNGS